MSCVLEQRMLILAVFQGLGLSGRVNPAFIERAPLTIRHGRAALAPRTWATAHQSSCLLAHLEWWRADSHGCRVLPNPCEWRSSSHENEGANDWRNETSNGRKLRQREEPLDDGQSVRSSLAPSLRFPLERLTNQMGSSIMSWAGG